MSTPVTISSTVRGRFIKLQTAPHRLFMSDPDGDLVELTFSNGNQEYVGLDAADTLIDALSAQVLPILRMRPEIQLHSGASYDYLAPERTPIAIRDVAHGLSRLTRYTGHLKVPFYSIAQHSVLAALNTKGDRYEALMHDAVESVLQDMNTPFKQLLRDYNRFEDIHQRHFSEVFGFSYPFSRETKDVDARMLVTERRDMGTPANDPTLWTYFDTIDPLEAPIFPMEADEAREAFLDLYEELRPANAPRIFG